MAATPYAPQSGTPYVLTNVDGYAAVFNDPTHASYVGALAGDDAITGFDSPEVREVGANLVEADGGVHGRFYYGRRPVTLQGYIDAGSISDRNAKMDRLMRASNAMRSDATLTWTVTGGLQTFLNVRRQQPLRLTGGWMKNFFLALVSADPHIYSAALNSSTGLASATNHTLENKGSSYTSPVLVRVTGPGTDPVVRRTYAGNTLNLQFNGLTLAGGQYIDINLQNRTIRRDDASNQYHTLNYTVSSWFEMGPGNNTLRLDWGSGSTGASVLRVDFRDAWL